MAKDDTADFAAAWQRDHELNQENKGITRLINFLYEKGALRASMFDGAGGYEWLVLYTENGAIDIRASDLRAESLIERQGR